MDPSNEVCLGNTNTDPFDNSCSNSISALGEKVATTSAIASISVNIVTQKPKDSNVEKLDEAFSL